MNPKRVSRWKPHRFFWLASLLVISALVLTLVWSARRPSPGKITWLSEGQAAKALQHGKLRDLKFKLLRRFSFLSNWYDKRRMILSIQGRFIGLLDEQNLLNQLPSLTSGNSEGFTGWVLNDEQWSKLKQWSRGPAPAVSSVSESVSTISESGITLKDDSQAEVSSGAIGNMTTIDIFPRVEHGSVNVLLKAASTLEFQTNFSMACYTVIPNGGALIVRGRKRNDPSGTNYWLMLSIVAIDAKGNPKKL